MIGAVSAERFDADVVVVGSGFGGSVAALRWAQAGKSATDIGAILGISGRTVEFHLNEACGRLGVRTRIQAISAAIELGFLSPGPS